MCQISDIDVCITIIKRRKDSLKKSTKKEGDKRKEVEIDYKSNGLNHIRLVIKSMHGHSTEYQKYSSLFMTPPYVDEENIFYY